MAEIYSKSLVRAIGEVLLVKLSQLKHIKVMKNGLFLWPTSITLDNNNDVLTDL